MSLELKIEHLIDAINNLAFIMQQQATIKPVAPVTAPAPAPSFPEVIPTANPVVAMPPLPTFITPAHAPVKPAPFNDIKGLTDYVMASWTTLGPEKGAKIQDIMVGLGYQHINDIKAEHYGTLFEKVEALK